MKQLFKRNTLLILFLVLIILYYGIIRNLLIPTSNNVMIELVFGIILILLTVISLVLLVLIFVPLLLSIVTFSSTSVKKWTKRLTNQLKTVLMTSLVLIIFTIITQLTAYTPPILDENASPLEGSITEIEKVNIDGDIQYITIRGKNKNNPVLLFLAGGPGGTQLAATRAILSDLEEHFVVINWDQPGSGKTYKPLKNNALTPEQYIEDGHELTQYLLEKFNKEKIYLVGQSWGSALSVWLAERYPDDYHAIINAAQMVSFYETEIYCYNTALELAEENGDYDVVRKLREQGEPPYYENATMLGATYLLYLFDEMSSNPNINHTNYDSMDDLLGPEYGLYDKVKYFIALYDTFNQVYPKLYDIDLREESTELDVPIYILHGRHDVNAPVTLAEEYYQLISAPHKELIWFEHSGHDLWKDESDLFVETLVSILNQNN